MLIKSKFSVPRSNRELIEREELHQKLAQRPQTVLIHAPLGYGKTSLVANWLNTAAYPQAWLNLDTRDNDADRFWNYLLSALEVAGNQLECGKRQNATVEHKITQCIELIGLDKYQDLVLVLDDAYVISSEQIWQQLNYFLDHLPVSVCSIIISRREPSIHTQHRKARGQLLEIKRQDLAFNLSETASLFQTEYKLPLDSNTLSDIQQSSEGWVAALHLIAGNLISEEDEESYSKRSIAENEVFTYLDNEVFKSVDLLEQKKLLQFACLEQADEACMESFLGPGYRDILTWENHNGFLFEHSPLPGVYRLHNMFRKMLLGKLQSDKAYWQQTVSLKIDWLLARNDFESALELIAEIKDWNKAIVVLGDISHELLKVGRTDYLENWIDQLPADLLWQDPKLLCIKAWLLRDVDKFKIGDTLLDHAESLIHQRGAISLSAEDKAVLGEVYALKATIARLRNDQEATLDFSKKSLKLAFNSTMPLRWRPYTSVGADHYYRGELNAAMDELSKAYEFAKLEGHIYGVALSGAYLGEVAFHLGKLKRAKFISEETDRWIREQQSNTEINESWRYVFKVGLALESNRLEEAQGYLEVMLAFRHHQDCEPLHYLIILLLWLRLLFLQEDVETIDIALTELEELSEKIHFEWPYAIARAEWMRLKYHALKGSWEQAQQLFDAIEGELNSEVSFVVVPNLIVAASYFLKTKQWNRAREIIRSIKSQCLELGQIYFSGKAKVLEVVLLIGEGAQKQAEELLQDVIEEYVELGFLNLILEEGTSIHQLIRNLVGRFPKNANLRRVMEHIPTENSASLIKLSNRELDIMRMLDLAKSDKEISDVYCISLGTVKTHLRNIYRKLEVRKRGQAVLRAKELGLYS